MAKVFTNGCFDILHLGHIKLLRYAKSQGDTLIVGVNSDASVKRLKGASRPINDEISRIELLKSLKIVDEVIIFHEDTPLEVIKKVKPDVIVKGGDYSAQEVVGSDLVKKVLIFPIEEGHSTSNIVAKCNKNLKLSPTYTLDQYILNSISSLELSAQEISTKSALIASKILATHKNGGTVYIFGNGGSAADSSHFAAELSIRYKSNRTPISAISLNSCIPSLTACSNDFSYDEIYERQLGAHLRKKDMVIGITTSGTSKNVLKALSFSTTKLSHEKIWLLTGNTYTLNDKYSIFRAFSSETAITQQIHMVLIHLICEHIDTALGNA